MGNGLISARTDKEADMVARSNPTQELHSKYTNVFSGIGCFKGTISLQVKEGEKPYQTQPRCRVYAQEPLEKETDYKSNK